MKTKKTTTISHFSCFLLLAIMAICVISCSGGDCELTSFTDDNGKVGLKKCEEVVLSPTYDAIGSFSEGLAPARQGDSWGYIDESGAVKLTFQYQRADVFQDGKAGVQLTGQNFMIDASGNCVSGCPGTFADDRDGQTYRWAMLEDGKKWMTQNLNYSTPDSWCYDDMDGMCSRLGRLYTWDAAQNACPEGWHLPSDEEWWNMANAYGQAYSVPKNNAGPNAGKAAYRSLIRGGNSGFSAVFAGNRDETGAYRYLDANGNYWSSTEAPANKAWFYNFYFSKKELKRNEFHKNWAFSCRCVED